MAPAEAKKAKMDTVAALSDFNIVKILRQDLSHHSFCLHLCHKETGADAVLIGNANPVSETVLRGELLDGTAKTELVMANDVYANLALLLPPALNKLKGTLIHPATPKHIAKYRERELEMVPETAAAYEAVTLPHLRAGNTFTLKWVDNFLTGKAEADRVLFDDPHPLLGFMLAPDLKWDGVDPSNLYCTAIVHAHDIHSIRDLRAAHIPLLENIREKSGRAILQKYGVQPDSLRFFFHYHPSFWHLHVHVVRLGADYPGMVVGKAHLVDDVANLLRLDGDAFAKLPLTFALPSDDPLLKLLRFGC